MATSPSSGTPPADPRRPQADRRALRGRLVIGRKGQDHRVSGRTWLAAIAVHVFVIGGMIRLVSLGHGLHDWFGLAPSSLEVQERITYVEPKPPEPKPAEPQPKPPEPKTAQVASAPSPVSPSAAPSGTRETPVDPALVAGARLFDSTGTGNGKPRDLGINPALIGLAPANGDPRVWEQGTGGINLERSPKQMLDSVIGWAIAQAADSLDSIARLENPNSKPADWTKRMKNGEKWGWDKTGLRLGKYTVPNALLALLPASVQRGMGSNPIEAANARALLLARSDIQRFSSQAMGEGDFRKAVKEMRARKEREYERRSSSRSREKNDKKAQPPPKAASGSSGPDRQ